MRIFRNWKTWWERRQINWAKDYTSTFEHPHRQLIIDQLKKWKWISLLEIGCGGGANLLRIRKEFRGKELGGMDVNRDAIQTTEEIDRNYVVKTGDEKGVTINKREVELLMTISPLFYKNKIVQFDKPWFLETRDFLTEGIFMSDAGLDIVLTDATCIYISPLKIRKALREIKRVTRFHVIFVEFHSKSLWERLKLWYRTGYFAHDWQRLLERAGFYNIEVQKIPKEAWPGTPWETYGHIITAHT